MKLIMTFKHSEVRELIASSEGPSIGEQVEMSIEEAFTQDAMIDSIKIAGLQELRKFPRNHRKAVKR